jgi:hypothetical protein
LETAKKPGQQMQLVDFMWMVMDALAESGTSIRDSHNSTINALMTMKYMTLQNRTIDG